MPHDYKSQRDVWVVYNTGSGAVVNVLLSTPAEDFTPPSNCEMFRTRLTEWAIMNSHSLTVRHGKVVHSTSLGGL